MAVIRLNYVANDWKHNSKTILKGSQIKKVNGMSCSDYLEHVKQNTWLRYLSYNKEWINDYGLIIDEGKDFKGWEIEFLLPNKATFKTFIPKVIGFPSAEDKSDNCTCRDYGQCGLYPY